MNKNEPIESLDDTPINPTKSTAIPNNKPTGIDVPLTEIASTVAPTDLNKQNINSFGQENIPNMNMNQKVGNSNLNTIPKNDEFNNIGQIPKYTNETTKPKFKINKPLLILIVFILIAAVGFGIYYYLSFGNSKKGTVTLKKIELQLGEKDYLNIEEYATFVNISTSGCLLNTDNINTNKVGKYKFEISCGNDTYTGTANVVDKEAPTLTTKIVTTKVKGEVTAVDFIDSCTDISECKYTIKEADKLAEYLNTAGTYQININAIDNYNNTITIKTYLIVLEKDLDWYLSCVSQSIETTEYEGTYLITDKIGLVSQDDQIIFGNVLYREYNFVYNNKTEFTKILETSKSSKEVTINGITGTPSFDEKNLTIKLVNVLTTEEFTKSFTNTMPNTFEEFKDYYESATKNYKCSLQ